jgi:hypothetical protein
LSLLAASVFTNILAAELLYLENFDNNQGFTRPAANVGWKGFEDGGHPITQSNIAEVGGTLTYPDDFPNIGDPTSSDYKIQSVLGNPDGINNSPIVDGTYGEIFWSPTAIYNVSISTQEYAGVLNSADIGTISWDHLVDVGSGGTQLVRALVQVGGSASDTDNWYVSNPYIEVDVTARAGLWVTDTVDASGNWIKVPAYNYATDTFSWPEGGPKTEADFAGYVGYTFYEGPLPAGTVHGFGILIDNRAGGNMRLDNYTIKTAVPVPIISIGLSGNDIEVNFESSSSLNYQLRKSTDNMATFPLVGSPVAGNDGVQTLTDIGAKPTSGVKIFYKVEVTE